ncbi:MAG: Rpn family recombination-promoting nuclease/putative transposase [Planctomycetaceae bacterium]|nr:Rpn family recombination-promoting nuclease/putative transposase [Planctomycetaceae bacterium]
MRTSSGKPFLPAAADIVFQYIFSSARSEECLLHFINAVRMSAGRPLAQKVEIRNPFNLKDYESDKKTILDIKATDEMDRTYDVEIQTANELAFPERMLYYWAQLYAGRLFSGEGYEQLRPVVSIVLTRFPLFSQLTDLHNVFNIAAEKDPKVLLTKHFEMHTLELTKPKWDRFMEQISTVPEGQRLLRNWIDFLLHSNQKTEAEMETLTCGTPGLELAYQKFVEVNSDERMRELAWAREKAARDEHGRLLFAKEEGRAEGRAEERAVNRAFLAQSLRRMLPLFYPESVTAETLERVWNIEETERLQEIMNAMSEQKPFERIAEIL